MYINAEIKNKKIIPNNPDWFNYVLSKYEGKQVEIKIEKLKKSRSTAQNNYYWGVVVQLLSEFTGFEHNEMHEQLKLLFNSEIEYKEINGVQKEFMRIKSTTQLTTEEFIKYIDNIIEWAFIELNVNIPPPEAI